MIQACPSCCSSIRAIPLAPVSDGILCRCPECGETHRVVLQVPTRPSRRVTWRPVTGET